MKAILKSIAYIASAAGLLTACTTDYPEPDQNGLPQASELEPVITVDQETNYVTFEVNNKGVVPMWIFGDESYDGKSNSRYAYAQNGVRLRFRDAGEHTVELKAYNVNGVSVGSKVLSFTLDNTYRDPFDQTPYVNVLAGSGEQTWMWNNDVQGHFGCGESGTEGLNWWSAAPNDKADWSLYDDRLTFTKDGHYTYSSGDGYVYVNKDSGYKTEYYLGDDQDYIAPIDDFTTEYHFEQSWNSAGIEEIYFVIPEGRNLSYIPNPEALANPRYLVLDSSISAMRKCLKLAIDNGGIVWHYEFIPEVKTASPEEMLAGTDGKGKAWVMDREAVGHLGCGESVENPTGWWSAQPNEKAGFGMYDDVLTFFPDGRYVFDPGADGKIYINKQIDNMPGSAKRDDNDYDLDWQVQESTYTFDGTTLRLPEGVVLGYVPHNNAYTNPVFTITELTEYNMTLVSFDAQDDGGYIAWQYKFRARDLEAPAQTVNGTAFTGGAVELSLAKGETVTVTGIDFDADGYYLDPDFFDYVNGTTATFRGIDGDYRIVNMGNWLKVLPTYAGELATWERGKALWIIGDGGGKPEGQLIDWNTDNALPCVQTGADTYEITLWMKAEGGSVKVFGQAGWGIEWTGDKYTSFQSNGLFGLDASRDSGNIYTENEGTTAAGFYTFKFKASGDMLEASVDKKKSTFYDPASAANKWLAATYEMSFWYAPGWAEIAPPGFAADGNSYKITLPEATTDQWQAQVAFHTDMSSSADKTYDFYLEMESNTDHPGVTIKLVLEGDDNVFYFADRHPLTAYEPFVYKMPNMAGIDMEKIALFFDFGGCAADTEVTVRNILFQEHQEQ